MYDSHILKSDGVNYAISYSRNERTMYNVYWLFASLLYYFH